MKEITKKMSELKAELGRISNIYSPNGSIEQECTHIIEAMMCALERKSVRGNRLAAFRNAVEVIEAGK